MSTSKVVGAALVAAAMSSCIAAPDTLELEVTSLCVRELELSFAGGDRTSAVTGFSIADYVDGGELAAAEVRLDHIALRPDGASPTLDVDAVAVELRSDARDPRLPPLVLIDHRPASAPGDDLVLPTDTDADLADYLSAGSLQLAIELSGVMPVAGWTAGMDVCFEVSGIHLERSR